MTSSSWPSTTLSACSPRTASSRRRWSNTIVYVIGTVPLTLVCSLAMAVLLNQNVRLRNFFRTVAFFPYVASLVAVAAVWNMIFQPRHGPH